MANIREHEQVADLRSKVLHASARLFLAKGFSNTTVKHIAEAANVPASQIYYEMKSKDEILSELVQYVLEGQFKATEGFLAGKTQDKILFYAAETTLQLHMAESSEQIRELYAAAYSLPKTSDIIQRTITDKLEYIFKEHLPHLETKDFYELEIASGGIMRGFMTIPCDMYFTMERKVRRFLETTFKLYDVPRQKIEEAIAFVQQFDYPALARQTVSNMVSVLEDRLRN